MIKKIDFGKTDLKDLHQVFKINTFEELEAKKARLFPNGNADNEIATTSIFLASLSAIKEYREELFLSIGITKLNARNAALHVYTELNNDKNGDRPDGLIVITSGKIEPVIEWAAFVEAKVRDNEINGNQIEKYIEFAREVGINDIITISNYLTSNPNESPVTTKKRNFNLYHWSWTYLKVTGSRLVHNNLIQDEDHVFIIKELRRYFDEHKNLNNFVNMGKDWKNSVIKIHGYSPEQQIDKDLLDKIIDSYKQEEKDISLQLTDKSNFHVELVCKKNRVAEIEEMLQKKKVITSNFMINKNKKNKFSIEIDFIRQRIKCYTMLTIEKGKAQAQTSALVKMFEDIGAVSHIIVNAVYPRNKSKNNDISLSQLIEEKNQSEPYSIIEKNFGKEIKYFEIKTEDLLGKDFKSVKNFIIKLENIAYRFLSHVIVNKK